MANLLKSSGHQPCTCFGDGLSSLAGIVYSSSKTVFYKKAGLQLFQLISVELQSQCRWNKLLWKLQACKISGLRNSSALHYLILMKISRDLLCDKALLPYPPCLHHLSSSLLGLKYISALCLLAHHFWRPHIPGTALAFRVFHLLQLQEATGWEALHSCRGSVLLCWLLQGVCCQEVCWLQESYYRYVGLNAAWGQWVLKVRTAIPKDMQLRGC